jgi:hypothetical protein
MGRTLLVGLWLGVCSWDVATAQGTDAKASSKSVESYGWDDRRLNVPRILNDLSSKEPITVRGALDVLAGGGDLAKPTIPAVRGLLRHKDALVRIDAAWTLIDLDDATDSNLTTILEAAVLLKFAAGGLLRILGLPDQVGKRASSLCCVPC